MGGAGFFSFLSNIAKKTVPILKKYVLPEALNLTSSLIDQSKQKSLNVDKIKDLTKQSLRNIGKNVVMNSGGRKRLRKKHKIGIRKKKKQKIGILKKKSKK